MYNNISKNDRLWDTEEYKKKCKYISIYVSKHDYLLVTEDFKKKCTSMNSQASKQSHLWDTEDFKRSVRPCTIMYPNTMKYETQKIIRKMCIHVQWTMKIWWSIRHRRF